MSDHYYPFRVKFEVEVYVQVEDSDIEDVLAEIHPGADDFDTAAQATAREKAFRSLGFVGSYADETTTIETKRVLSVSGL